MTDALATNQRITSAEMLPHFTEVLTCVGGMVALRKEDMRVLIAVRVKSQEAVIIHSGTGEAKELAQAVRRKLELYKLNVIDVTTADESMIAVAYGRSGKESEARASDSEAQAWARNLLTLAVERGASDIHLNVYEETAKINFRIDGDIATGIPDITRADAAEYSRAMFVMADEDTRRGHASFDPNVQMGCSLTETVYPTIKGKSVRTQIKVRWESSPAAPSSWDIVLRIHVLGKRNRTVKELGYSKAQIELLDYALRFPEGMFLMVGTTGSGKSTTLAAMIEKAFYDAGGKKSIQTIEDPPEIPMANSAVRATPIPKAKEGEGSMFAKALKSKMRQDPDQLMVGELRDAETAIMAQQAAQTGHKMYGTLHVNGTAGTVARLEQLGMELPVITQRGFINAIVYQKLLQVMCPHCKVSLHTPTGQKMLTPLMDEELHKLNEDPKYSLEMVHLKGPGCDQCNNGVQGRTVAAEIMIPDATMLELYAEKKYNIAQAYWEGGLCRYRGTDQMKTAMDNAIEKMLDGEICPFEVMKHFNEFSARIDHKAAAERYHVWESRNQK